MLLPNTVYTVAEYRNKVNTRIHKYEKRNISNNSFAPIMTKKTHNSSLFNILFDFTGTDIIKMDMFGTLCLYMYLWSIKKQKKKKPTFRCDFSICVIAFAFELCCGFCRAFWATIHILTHQCTLNTRMSPYLLLSINKASINTTNLFLYKNKAQAYLFRNRDNAIKPLVLDQNLFAVISLNIVISIISSYCGLCMSIILTYLCVCVCFCGYVKGPNRKILLDMLCSVGVQRCLPPPPSSLPVSMSPGIGETTFP